MIAAKGVHHSYGTTHALVDVDLAVGAGEIVGIIGPNGSGKSTLLKVLAGILSGRPGEVRLGEEEVHAIPPRERARRIAYCPQASDGAFEFTVGEVVLLGRTPYLGGMGFEREEDVRAARAALESVDALHLAARPMPAISGGERQRVMIARALAQATEIIILDEPTAHLDLRHQGAIYGLLRRRCAEGAAVILVSHDLNLPARFCTRIVALKEGRLVAEGPPREVIREDSIRRIFGARVKVIEDGGPVVVPLPGEGP